MDPTQSSSSSSRSGRRPKSSAALLHYLHNDPAAHHVTLAASPSRATSQTPTTDVKSASLGIPLEPTVVDQNRPPLPSPRRPPLTSSTSSFSRESIAGPSTKVPLTRGTSYKRTNRPKTAPGKSPSLGYQDERSPEPASTSRFEAEPMRDLEDIPAQTEVDSCTLAIDDLSGAAEMMSLVEGGEQQTSVTGRGVIVGRSGSSMPTISQSEGKQDPMSWRTFGYSYANGRFDPNRIPALPETSNASPDVIPSAHSSPGQQTSKLVDRSDDATDSSGSLRTLSSKTTSSGSTLTSTSSAPSTGSSSQPIPINKPGSMAAAIAARKKPFELNKPPSLPTHSELTKPDQLDLPSYSLAAATVRMAAAGFRGSDFAPLNIPSPERELMDPMSSVISHSSSINSASSDPGPSKYPLNRSYSNADSGSSGRDLLSSPAAPQLTTILASPVTTPDEDRLKGRVRELAVPRHGGIVHSGRIPAASAPLERATETEVATDYFGTASASPHLDRKQSEVSQSSSSQTVTGAADRPASPKSSSSTPPALVQAAEIGPLYQKYGWLPAPIPADELARRKALYRYSILHTSPDVNFDRIAHMAKLVFSAKIVLIALIDSEMQWHKSETGLGSMETSRVSSFCSHAVLAKNDEPFVVCDTKLDWRFQENPQVVGPPYIRFYAGAPLRTSDGYNLGSLCIIDDKPRQDFPPRSRLILKEFAAVAMREMELWRDKIQLRTRDKIQVSMEQFSRECLEMDAKSTASNAEAAAKMDQVYSRAAKLVSTTLDLDGCVILDIGQFEMMEVEGPNGPTKVYRANPYGDDTNESSPVVERSDGFGAVSALPVLATTPTSVPTRPLTANEHEKLSEFLRDNREGRIFENVAPSWIRYMFPAALKYGMVVPIFGVDEQPFALICAYTCDKAKQFLEGYELQFLRAIGVVILSAVLKRRMVLADKAKSILISSVSHELRTPLHGILAAAELLADTSLDSNQASFLKTVQTCGNSLIETVNHVLDFTKLSGSTKSSGGGSIKLARVNLASLVESTVEGCWIGQRARVFHGDADIGSFYAPPASSMIPKDQRQSIGEKLNHVETVIDIAQREKGWNVRCEKGGLRRVLMNLVGNSLKFTTDGFVQVTLRELPHDPGSKMIPVEMAVIDTGKGIGKEFLKEQLFHPFSQENPLQTGTGLGLAIVNSIVRSDSVNGKVDVWSAEGTGTEIRVSFDVEVIDDEDDSSSASSVTSISQQFGTGYSISLDGFTKEHRGLELERDVLSGYAQFWDFSVQESPGDVLVINEDIEQLQAAKQGEKPVLFLISTRATGVNAIRDEINQSGGYCQTLHKPIGPAGFKRALRDAIDWLEQPEDDAPGSDNDLLNRPPISRGSSGASAESASTISELVSQKSSVQGVERAPLTRRRSEEDQQSISSRPAMAPRGMTYHAPARRRMPSGSAAENPSPGSPTSTISTISLAGGGVLLQAAALPERSGRDRSARVMVVEDNQINRRVLGAFLKKNGYEYHEAMDGKEGVDLFAQTPPNYWNIILMDISMPVMNGYEATAAIRQIEATRREAAPSPPLPPGTVQPIPPHRRSSIIPPPQIVQSRTKIFALTGLATADDKRKAFGSGVDGYLVKPVSLASLDLVFQKIGF